MQTKPLRGYGIDVTMSSLQPILDSLGIDEQVKNMSQAEKEILRYLATLKQAQIAMGDLANTIESPSNQLKIFRQQLVEAKVALSSLFIGAFSKILPYANAILMVIKEVSKAIADMFGIEITDYNSGIASQEGIYDGIEESAGNANKAVKELKRQVLGFDEIHNINENKDSGSGSSGGVSGGIDQRLLDAIKGYDNGMDKVRMKATEIRDKIMEWLGFTKLVDEETGKVYFKLKEGNTRFKKIAETVKFMFDHALDALKIIVGYKILKTVTQVWDVLKKVKNIWKEMGSVGKITLSVIIAMDLANDISKTDWYKGFANALSGGTWEEYGNPSLFKAWGEIAKGYKEVSEQNYNNFLQQQENIYSWIYMLDEANDNGNKELYNNAMMHLKKYDEEYVNMLAFVYSKNKEKIKQQLFGNSIFDDNSNIQSYTDTLKKYFEDLTSGTSVVEKYNSVVEESSKKYAEAEEELGTLLAQMNTDQYEVTQEDIDKINDCLSRMAESSNESGQAFVDTVTKMTIKLQNQGLVSDKTAKKVIENAKKKQLAEKGFTEKYINEVIDLDNKLKDGKITNKQYTDSLIEIYKKYNKTTDATKSTTETFKTLSDGIKITGENWSELSNTTETANTLFNDSMKKVKDTTQENIKFWGDYLATLDEGSEEYKYVSEMIQAENKSQKESIKKLEDGYALYLTNILNSLVNSKEIYTKEGRELANKLNGELSKLGYGIDLDIDNNMNKTKEKLKIQLNSLTSESKNSKENINKNLSDIGKKTYENLKPEIDKIKTALGFKGVKIGSGISISSTFNTVLDSVKKKISSTFSGSLSKIFGISVKEKGGIYSNGSWKDIPQYANGGAPSHGSLVFAGENGPEILGNANGRTEILNQSQIASAIYSAVYSAMSQFGGQSNEIEVHVHTDEGTVVDRINQKTKQTGVCPINIPL